MATHHQKRPGVLLCHDYLLDLMIELTPTLSGGGETTPESCLVA
jgi:hypothetical protein